MDSAEQHIHLLRAIMQAGATQDESLYIRPSRPTEMCLQQTSNSNTCVCFMLFVAPEDGGVCVYMVPFHVIQFVGGKATAVNPLEDWKGNLEKASVVKPCNHR